MANVGQKWHNSKNRSYYGLDVFKIFTGNYSSEFYASEISKKLKMPKRSVLRKLDYLCKINMLKFKREGKNKVFFINFDNPQLLQFLVFAESYKATNFLLENPKLAWILKQIDCGKIIFGSYAKKNHSSNSDLDIVLLQKENRKTEEILRNSPIKIHPQFSTIDNLTRKLEKNDSLAKEILNNHIVLNNFESIIKLLINYSNT